jgi:hypothetical protein
MVDQLALLKRVVGTVRARAVGAMQLCERRQIQQLEASLR